DPTLMFGDDPVNGREPQPGAAADLFRGEERLIDPMPDRLIDSAAVVRNAKADISAAFGLRMEAAMRLVDFDIFDADQDARLPGRRSRLLLASFHPVKQGVACIDAEVHDQLVHLTGISQHHPEIGVGFNLDLDFAVDRLPEETDHLPRFRSEILRLLMDRAPTAEREKLLGQAGRQAACWAMSTSVKSSLPGGSSSSVRASPPVIAVRRLLNSCATPPVS